MLLGDLMAKIGDKNVIIVDDNGKVYEIKNIGTNINGGYTITIKKPITKKKSATDRIAESLEQIVKNMEEFKDKIKIGEK